MNTFAFITHPVGPTCGRPRQSNLKSPEAARSAALPGYSSQSPSRLSTCITQLFALLLVLFFAGTPLFAQPYCGNNSGGFVSGDPGGNEEDPDCEDDGNGDANGEKDAGNGPGNKGPAPGLPPAGAGGSGGFNRFKPRTGNLHRVIKDLRLFAGVGQHRLEFRRIYNSRAISAEQYFGDGWSWTHSYQWSISNVGAGGDDVFRVIFPSGTRNDFADIGDGLTFRTTAAFPEYVSRESGTSTNYTLNLRNGFRYRFTRQESTEGFKYVMQGFWDSHGSWYAFTNDGDGRFVRVTEPTGRWLEVSYNTNGHITQVDASDGRTVTYSYQNLDPEDPNTPILLTGADYGDGTTASYEYTPGQWPMLVHAVDPKYPGKGSNIRYTYWTSWGYLMEERDGVTDELLVTNNGGSVVYANGTSVTWTWNELGLPLTKTDALGGVKTYTYDTNGFPDSVTDELGNVTYRTNNAMGNVVGRTYADNSTESWTRDSLEQVLTYTDRLGRTTSYTRDTNSLVTRIDFADSTYETFTYDGYQKLIAHRLRNGATNTTTYATNGLKTASTDALGVVTTYGYDSLHRLAFITNGLGNVTSFDYNPRGLITKITHPDSTWKAFGYDNFGNKIAETNELGKVWNYAYNIFRQVTATVDPLGRTNTFDYYTNANCCSGTTGDNVTRFTSPSGRTVDFEYDLLGRKVAEILAAGTGAASSNLFQYDAVGNLTNRIDGLSNSWQTVFDAMNRPVASIDPLGRTNTFTYDAGGNRLTATRPDGTASANYYDSMDRLVATVDALNQTNSFAYNALGQLVTLTDAKGNVTQWAFDALGRQTNKAYADSNGDTYRYDAVGRLTNHVNGAGQSQTLTYDSRGRLLTTAWNDGSTSATLRSYDAAGHLLSLSNASSTITHTYDDAGQLLTDAQTLSPSTNALTVAYAYTLDGQRRTMTYPGGLVLTNDYTARGQLASLTFDGPPPLVTYTYDAAGQRLTRAYENGATAYYTNDAAGQLLALAHVKVSNGSVIAQVNYGYNGVGNRTNRVESYTGFTTATDAYAYDLTDQLTAVSYNGGARTTSFDYDKMGNLTNRQDTATGTNSYTANSLNQLSTLNSQALNYDGSGNLTNRPGWLYVWNANNQLMVAEPSSPTNGSVKMLFAYDGKHRCVKRQTWTWNSGSYSLSSTFYLLYSGWNLIEERDAGTNIVTYVHGPRVDEILAKFTSTNTVFYHGDAHHSTLALTDATANVLERYRYEAFGLPSVYDSAFNLQPSTAYGNRMLFQGREWLAEVKLTDHRYRYYSPDLQRWLSRDPITEKGGINIYAYLANSPMIWVDSYGLCGADDPCAAQRKAVDDATDRVGRAQARVDAGKVLMDFLVEEAIVKAGIFTAASIIAVGSCLSLGPLACAYAVGNAAAHGVVANAAANQAAMAMSSYAEQVTELNAAKESLTSAKQALDACLAAANL